MDWVSLHHHSTFSFMDGFGTPEQHVARAAELGMNALALTEHGNVSSHVRLEQAADRYGIKPIFGCELYTGAVDDEWRSQNKWHLTVLAENETGYRNLLRLVTRGWDEGFYYEPTVSGNMLAEHSEGLIVLSGCSGSKMATDLLGGKGRPVEDGDIQRARDTAQRMKNLLGDRFYLEAQAFPTLDRACDINQAWEQLSQETGIPLVATGDIHYPRPEDSEMQIILHAAGRGNNTFESQARSWGYDTKLTSPLTDRDVYRMMRGTGLGKKAAEASVRNAIEISQRINFRLPKAAPLRYPTDDSRAMFRRLLNNGWKYRGFNRLSKADREAAKARVARETEVIEGKDFIDYFLILADVTTFAKDSGIPVGPARGSAAASLVCYLLRITEINPMQYPTMFFERFIDESRQDLPDVDLDFDDERRDELREYLVGKYGTDKVGNIGTFIKYRGKNSVVDVARVHQLPYAEMEEFKNLLITRSGGDSRFDATLEDTVEMFPRAKAIWEAYPQLRQAARLEGNMKGMSVHAAGLVISNTPITDTCALYTKKDRGKDDDPTRILSVDKNDAEYLNLIKADFLGLKTMGMIRIALELAGLTLDDLYDIQMDEPETLKAFKDNDVVGIFQFEGRATRLVNKDVNPDNFMELADINALSRPGPLFSGTTHNYIDVKHGVAEAESLHPIVDRITSFTNGQIIYQEQILQIVREIGDFPWTKAGVIRKIISHKKGEAAFNALYDEFEEGANRLHGIPPEVATAIWKRIVTAGTYAFCTTGDTIVQTGGAGSNGGGTYTLEKLWKAYHSKTPLGDKLRYGRRGKRIQLRQMDDDGRIRPDQFLSISRSDVRMPVYRVRLANGNTFKSTIMHRVLTDSGYKEIGDLTTADSLVCTGEPHTPTATPKVFGGMRAARREVMERANVCEHCDRESDGTSHSLELAHIVSLDDLCGDATKFNDPNNILLLCNSCHKRFDYGKGERVRRFTHGSSTVLSQVVDVTPLKQREWVYMIEMDSDNHNYVANDVVHHNNVAHAVSYSTLGFWCMWLKVHHPLEFYTAQLIKTEEAGWPKLVKDAERHSIRVKGAHLNKSGITWTPDRSDGSIRAGFLQIKGIGEKYADRIVEYRDEHGDFQEWDDLLKISGIGPAKMQIIRASADDDDPFGLLETARILAEIREEIESGKLPVPEPNCTSDDLIDWPANRRACWMGIVRTRNYQDTIENRRARTGEEVEEIMAKLKSPNLVTSCVLFSYDDGDEDVYLRINRFDYPRLKETLESIDVGRDVVVAVGQKREGAFGISLHINKLYVIEP